MTATPPVYPDFAVEPVEWTVADYFYVADELYQHAQNDTLDGWMLKTMNFRSNCSDIEKGFQTAGFNFFKSVPTQTGSSRVEIILYVDPAENIALVFDVVYTPELNEWKHIDPSQVKIDAHGALLIAEENGGKDFRTSVNNQCYVLATNDAEGKYEGWHVGYSSGNEWFDIVIDPSTGEYRKVR
jgi:hypothetical protein